MGELLPFIRFYGLGIVPVLAMMLVFPASAQTSSSSAIQGTNPETQGTAPSSSTSTKPNKK